MKIVLAVIFIFAISFSGYSIHTQTIPAQINDNGNIFIDVKINDTASAKFMLDTGGGLCVLSNKLYQKFKNSMKAEGIFTGFRHDGERLDVELYSFPSLTVGNYRITAVKTGVYPPLDDYGIDGIISLKEFENQPVTLDFKNSKVVIEDRESMQQIEKTAAAIPILIDDMRGLTIDIFVPLCLNDSVHIEAEFDTGSGYNTLLINPYFMSKLGIDSSAVKKTPYQTPISGRQLYDYNSTFHSLKYCGTGLESIDPPAFFRENLIYDGLIGAGMFKNKILTIDIPNKRMLVRE